jgi:hypothetical protein
METVDDYPDPPEFEKSLQQFAKHILRKQYATEAELFLGAAQYFAELAHLKLTTDEFQVSQDVENHDSEYLAEDT